MYTMQRPARASAAVRAQSWDAVYGKMRPRVFTPRGGEAAAPPESAAARVCTKPSWRGGTRARLGAIVAALEVNPLEASFHISSHQLAAFSALIDELPLCAADECCGDPSVLSVCSMLSQSLKHSARAAVTSMSSWLTSAAAKGGNPSTLSVWREDQELTGTSAATGVFLPRSREERNEAALLSRTGGAKCGRDIRAYGERMRGDTGTESRRVTNISRCGVITGLVAEGISREWTAAVGPRRRGYDIEPHHEELKSTGLGGRVRRPVGGDGEQGKGNQGDWLYKENVEPVLRAHAGGEPNGGTHRSAASANIPVVIPACERNPAPKLLYETVSRESVSSGVWTFPGERYTREERRHYSERPALHASSRTADVAAGTAATQADIMATSAYTERSHTRPFSPDLGPQVNYTQQQREPQNEQLYGERHPAHLEHSKQAFQQQLQQYYVQQQYQQHIQQQNGAQGFGSYPPATYPAVCGISTASECSLHRTFSASSQHGQTSVSGHGLFASSIPSGFPSLEPLAYCRVPDDSSGRRIAVPHSGSCTDGAPTDPCGSNTAAFRGASCIDTARPTGTIPSSTGTIDTLAPPYCRGYAASALPWDGPSSGGAPVAAGVVPPFSTNNENVATNDDSGAHALLDTSRAATAATAAVQSWNGGGVRDSTDCVFPALQSIPEEEDYKQHTFLRNTSGMQLQASNHHEEEICNNQLPLPSRHNAEVEGTIVQRVAVDWLRQGSTVGQGICSKAASPHNRVIHLPTESKTTAAASSSGVQPSHISVSDAATTLGVYTSATVDNGIAPTQNAQHSLYAQPPTLRTGVNRERTDGGTEPSAGSDAFSAHDVPLTDVYAYTSLPAEAGAHASRAHLNLTTPEAVQQLASCSTGSYFRSSSQADNYDSAYRKGNTYTDAPHNDTTDNDVTTGRSASHSSGSVCVSGGTTGTVGLKAFCSNNRNVAVCFGRGPFTNINGHECACGNTSSVGPAHNTGEGDSSRTDSDHYTGTWGSRPAAPTAFEKQGNCEGPAHDIDSSRNTTHADVSTGEPYCFPTVPGADLGGNKWEGAAKTTEALVASGGLPGPPFRENVWPGRHLHPTSTVSGAFDPPEGDKRASEEDPTNTKNIEISKAFDSTPNCTYPHDNIPCAAAPEATRTACVPVLPTVQHKSTTPGTAGDLPPADASLPGAERVCADTRLMACVPVSSLNNINEAGAPPLVADAAEAGDAECRSGDGGGPLSPAASFSTEIHALQEGDAVQKQQQLMQRQRRSYSTCCSSSESLPIGSQWGGSSRSVSLTDQKGEAVRKYTQKLLVERQEIPTYTNAPGNNSRLEILEEEKLLQEIELEPAVIPGGGCGVQRKEVESAALRDGSFFQNRDCDSTPPGEKEFSQGVKRKLPPLGEEGVFVVTATEANKEKVRPSEGKMVPSPSLRFSSSSNSTTILATEEDARQQENAVAVNQQAAEARRLPKIDACASQVDHLKESQASKPSQVFQSDWHEKSIQRRREAGDEERPEDSRGTVVETSGMETAEDGGGSATPIAVEVETVSASGPESLLLCLRAASTQQKYAFHVNRLDLLLIAASQLPHLKKMRQQRLTQEQKGQLSGSRKNQLIEQEEGEEGGAQDGLVWPLKDKTTCGTLLSSSGGSVHEATLNSFPQNSHSITSEDTSTSIVYSRLPRNSERKNNNTSSSILQNDSELTLEASQLQGSSCSSNISHQVVYSGPPHTNTLITSEAQTCLTLSVANTSPQDSGFAAAESGKQGEHMMEAKDGADNTNEMSALDRGERKAETAGLLDTVTHVDGVSSEVTQGEKTEAIVVSEFCSGHHTRGQSVAATALTSGGKGPEEALTAAEREEAACTNNVALHAVACTSRAAVDAIVYDDDPRFEGEKGCVTVHEDLTMMNVQQGQKTGDNFRGHVIAAATRGGALVHTIGGRWERTEKNSDVPKQEGSGSECGAHMAEDPARRRSIRSEVKDGNLECGGKITMARTRQMSNIDSTEAFLTEQFGQGEVLQELWEELLQKEKALKQKETHLRDLQEQLVQQRRTCLTHRGWPEAKGLQSVHMKHVGDTEEAVVGDERKKEEEKDEEKKDGEKEQTEPLLVTQKSMAAYTDNWPTHGGVQLQRKKSINGGDDTYNVENRTGQQNAPEGPVSIQTTQQQAAQQNSLSQQGLVQSDMGAAQGLADRGVLQPERFYETKARFLAQLEELRPLLHAAAFEGIKTALADCRNVVQLSMWMGVFEVGANESMEAVVARLLGVAEYICGWRGEAAARSNSTYTGSAAAAVTPYVCVWPSSGVVTSCGSFSSAPAASAQYSGQPQVYFPPTFLGSNEAAAAAASMATSSASVAAASAAVAAATTPYWSGASVDAFPGPTAAEAEHGQTASYQQTPVAAVEAAAEQVPSVLHLSAESPHVRFQENSTLVAVSGRGIRSSTALDECVLYTTDTRTGATPPSYHPHGMAAAAQQPPATIAADNRGEDEVSSCVVRRTLTRATIKTSSCGSAALSPAAPNAAAAAAVVVDSAWKETTTATASAAAKRQQAVTALGEGGDAQAPLTEHDNCTCAGIQRLLQHQKKTGADRSASVGKDGMPLMSPAAFAAHPLPSVADGSASCHTAAAASSDTLNTSNTAGAETWHPEEGHGLLSEGDGRACYTHQARLYTSPLRTPQYQAAASLGYCTNNAASSRANTLSSFTPSMVAEVHLPRLPPAAGLNGLQDGSERATEGESGERRIGSAMICTRERRQHDSEDANGGRRESACLCGGRSNCAKCRGNRPSECSPAREVRPAGLLLRSETHQEQQPLVVPHHRIEETAAHQRELRHGDFEQLDATHCLQEPCMPYVPPSLQQWETVHGEFKESVAQSQQPEQWYIQQQQRQLFPWKHQRPDTMQQQPLTRLGIQRAAQATPTRLPEGNGQDDGLPLRVPNSNQVEDFHPRDVDERSEGGPSCPYAGSTGTEERPSEHNTAAAAEEESVFPLQKSNMNSTEATPVEKIIRTTAEQELGVTSQCVTCSPDGERELLLPGGSVTSAKVKKRLHQQTHPVAGTAARSERGWKKMRCSSPRARACGSPRHPRICEPLGPASQQQHTRQQRPPHLCSHLLGRRGLSHEEDLARDTEGRADSVVGGKEVSLALEDEANKEKTEQDCSRTPVLLPSSHPSPYTWGYLPSCPAPPASSRESRINLSGNPASLSAEAATSVSPVVLPAAAAACPASSSSLSGRSAVSYISRETNKCVESSDAASPQMHEEGLPTLALNPRANQVDVCTSKARREGDCEMHAGSPPASYPLYPSCSLYGEYAGNHQLSAPSGGGTPRTVSHSSTYSHTLHPHGKPGSIFMHAGPTGEVPAAPAAEGSLLLVSTSASHAAARSRELFPVEGACKESGRSRQSLTPSVHCRSRTPDTSPRISLCSTVERTAMRGGSHSLSTAIRQWPPETVDHGDISLSAAAPGGAAGGRYPNTSREAGARDDYLRPYRSRSSLRPSRHIFEDEKGPLESASGSSADRSSKSPLLRYFDESNTKGRVSLAGNTILTCSSGTRSAEEGTSSSKNNSCNVGSDGPSGAQVVAVKASVEAERETDIGNSKRVACTEVHACRLRREDVHPLPAAEVAACAPECVIVAKETTEPEDNGCCFQRSSRPLRESFEGGGLQLTRSISNSTSKDDFHCYLDAELTNNAADWITAARRNSGLRRAGSAAYGGPLQAWCDHGEEALTGLAGREKGCNSATELSKANSLPTLLCHDSSCDAEHGGIFAAAAEGQEPSEALNSMPWNRQREHLAPLPTNRIEAGVPATPKPWGCVGAPAVVILGNKEVQQRRRSQEWVANHQMASNSKAEKIALARGTAEAASAAVPADRKEFSTAGARSEGAHRVLAACNGTAAATGVAIADVPFPPEGRDASPAVTERLSVGKEEDYEPATYREKEPGHTASLCQPRIAEDACQWRIQQLLWEYKSVSRSSSFRSMGCNRIHSTVHSRTASIVAGEGETPVNNPLFLSLNGSRELDCLDGVGGVSSQSGGLEKALFDFQYT